MKIQGTVLAPTFRKNVLSLVYALTLEQAHELKERKTIIEVKKEIGLSLIEAGIAIEIPESKTNNVKDKKESK